MARIRTIKPEFPQSESMGRVSRDARLLFVELWTICDDEGRARAVSRMLASLLFPYDDDAPALIDGWLEELEREGCIVRYQADGSTYLQVCNWLNHQKIDKPSKSKIPQFSDGSRILAKPRECSSEDQGSRTKDQGVDQKGGTPAKPARFDPLAIELPSCIPPEAWAEWIAYRRKRKLSTTEQTARAQVDNLATWAAIGQPPDKVIAQSISNGWQGLFELKAGAIPPADRQKDSRYHFDSQEYRKKIAEEAKKYGRPLTDEERERAMEGF